MYVRKIKISNYGPIEDMELAMPFSENELPLPVILIGQNGAGKTILLSNILHSLIEIKRVKYNQISEVSGDNYYRVGSFNYINNSAMSAYERVEFDCDSSFTEVITKDYNEFSKNYTEEQYPAVNISDKDLKSTGFFSSVNTPIDKEFDENVYLYFPIDRYYIPTWENRKNDGLMYVSQDEDFVGMSSSNIVKYNVIQSIEEWFVDIIIDKEFYEKRSLCDANGNTQIVYLGKNSNIQKIVNQMVSILYRCKGYDSARIVISKRRGLSRRIEVVGQKGKKEEIILPTFTNMSSGEAMVLGMMASILREVDRICPSSSFDVRKIKGIVLIDEIDAHLHSDLLQEALPSLIEMFPAVQFIVSSHSPFFLLGMHDRFENKCRFVDLPSGNFVGDIIDFQEIRNCYNLVDKHYLSTISELKEQKKRQDEALLSIRKTIDEANAPLILTEGKTDTELLQIARERLGLHAFDDCSIQPVISGTTSNNEVLLRYLKDLNDNSRDSFKYPVIGMFDRDTPLWYGKGTEKIDIREERFVKIAKNIFAFAIPVPHNRNEKNQISIEHYFTDEEIKTYDGDKRLFLGNEFYSTGVYVGEEDYYFKGASSLSGTIKIIEHETKTYVTKGDGTGDYSISKARFAENIATKKGDFAKLSFEEFRMIFDIIQEIIDLYNKEKNEDV